MKKVLVITALLCVVAIGTAGAQAEFRLDTGLSVPIAWGAYGFGTTFSDTMKFVFVIPEEDAYFQLDFNVVKLGIGIRLFTVILESAILPDLFVEFNLDPIVIRASVSGFGIVLFGLFSYTSFGTTIAPDLSVAFKIGKIFRIGAGCTFLTDFSNMSAFAYFPYIQARLTFAFGEPEKAKADSGK
jgi:hypothetical protein